MDRRAFVGAMASGLLALPFAAKAQRWGKRGWIVVQSCGEEQPR